jgi:hypothetical protein
MRAVEVFGKRLLVERTADGWRTFIPGEDGKRRHPQALLCRVSSSPMMISFSTLQTCGTRVPVLIGRRCAG